MTRGEAEATVGEVREADGVRGLVARVNDPIFWSDAATPTPSEVWFYGGRIVEVAPCNRARVTAGPPWMRGAR